MIRLRMSVEMVHHAYFLSTTNADFLTRRPGRIDPALASRQEVVLQSKVDPQIISGHASLATSVTRE